ncbi:hypothetical protein DI291_21350 [Bacillus paralicheniformis]|nr:hypothetical protein DI291_21350 [Bacillus paralicheniformis]
MLEDDKLITEKRWFSRVPQWVPRWSGPRENTYRRYRYDTVGIKAQEFLLLIKELLSGAFLLFTGNRLRIRKGMQL